MNGEQIREDAAELVRDITKLQQKLTDLRLLCPHEIISGEYKGNTGNWCPDDDSYWITAVCEDCGGYIHADSGTEDYNRLSRSGMISNQYEPKEAAVERERLKLGIRLKRMEEI